MKTRSFRRKKNRVCLAIPTYNREEALLDTLRSAFQLVPVPDEILVVDQTPAHEKQTEKFLEKGQKSGRLKWIRQETPNLPMARNRALRETRCDLVVFIDDDVVMPRKFLFYHTRNFTDDRTDGVAGKVIQEDTSSFPNPPEGWRWPRILDPFYFAVNSDKRAEGIATFRGCNHSVRVRRALEWGGYDENFIGNAVGEENDFALRIWKAGGKIVFDPQADLFHLVAPSGGCRVPVPRKKNPEWMVYFAVTYFSFRHYFPSLIFWYGTLWGNFKGYVFRDVNRRNPWRLPWACLSYGYAWFRAGWKAHRRGKGENLPFAALARQELNEFNRSRVREKFRGLLKGRA